MTIFYPDVSSYQAGISFAGCVIVMVKATEGTGYTNPDYAAAKVAGGQCRRLFLRLPLPARGQWSGPGIICRRVSPAAEDPLPILSGQ
jgi:hypothetical protein